MAAGKPAALRAGRWAASANRWESLLHVRAAAFAVATERVQEVCAATVHSLRKPVTSLSLCSLGGMYQKEYYPYKKGCPVRKDYCSGGKVPQIPAPSKPGEKSGASSAGVHMWLGGSIGYWQKGACSCTSRQQQ